MDIVENTQYNTDDQNCNDFLEALEELEVLEVLEALECFLQNNLQRRKKQYVIEINSK